MGKSSGFISLFRRKNFRKRLGTWRKGSNRNEFANIGSASMGRVSRFVVMFWRESFRKKQGPFGFTNMMSANGRAVMVKRERQPIAMSQNAMKKMLVWWPKPSETAGVTCSKKTSARAS